MLNSQNDSGNNTASNAPDAAAFAAQEAPREEILAVSGAAWAEYHLLLGQSSPHCTRIESEIRTFGGAPTIAILLARWSAQNPDTAHIVIELTLTLGHDPNARLLRRELEKWQSKLSNLRVRILEDAAAPEVAYRILMWPQAFASTWGKPQVLEHGEIGRYCKIGKPGAEVLFEVSFETPEFTDGAAAIAAIAAGAWAGILGRPRRRLLKLSLAAGACWNRQRATERIACALSWAEVEAEAQNAAEVEGCQSI